MSKALLQDISENLQAGKGRGGRNKEKEGEIRTSLTPQTVSSSPSSSLCDSINSSVYTEERDLEGPQFGVNNEVTQGTTRFLDPNVRRVDEILAAAPLRGILFI